MMMNRTKLEAALAVCRYTFGLLIVLAPTAYAQVTDNTYSATPYRNSDDVIYMDAGTLNEELRQAPDMNSLLQQVRQKGNRILIDFTTLKDPESINKAREQMKQQFAIAIKGNWILVSRYKGELMFTAYANRPDITAAPVISAEDNTDSAPRLMGTANAVTKTEAELPHVTFYLNVNRKISDAECTFPRSHEFDLGVRKFCDSGNIALIYRISLQRSLQYGTTGSATPDAKIVRISLDNDSAGAGIQLNDKLKWVENINPKKVLAGWVRDYSTDAIAQDYTFAIRADNDKAAILKSQPGSLNSQYYSLDTSGFDLGVAGGGASMTPKTQLSASDVYNQKRQLLFNTQDYRVERSVPSAQSIAFSWVREQYATADSLLLSHQSISDDPHYMVDMTRIKPLSHKGFVPNLDVIYKAEPGESGSTRFIIDSSVDIRPIYTGTYKTGKTLTYYGFDDPEDNRRVTTTATFDVNWNHPVFTGARPVNLQLAGFNNRCINITDDYHTEIATCDEHSGSQSFIYDGHSRYVSALNSKMCLDGDSLKQLQPCTLSLTQLWKWLPDSDYFFNLGKEMALGHNTETDELGLFYQKGNPQPNISLHTITSYNNIFIP
ncbi:MAG: leukocidin family pore-forming toxin [Enterobacteriaceae bacterium]